MITVTSMKQLSELVNTNKDKKIKVEIKIRKDTAKKHFCPMQIGVFEQLYKGIVYATYFKGELESYQFGKGFDY